MSSGLLLMKHGGRTLFRSVTKYDDCCITSQSPPFKWRREKTGVVVVVYVVLCIFLFECAVFPPNILFSYYFIRTKFGYIWN